MAVHMSWHGIVTDGMVISVKNHVKMYIVSDNIPIREN